MEVKKLVGLIKNDNQTLQLKVSVIIRSLMDNILQKNIKTIYGNIEEIKFTMNSFKKTSNIFSESVKSRSNKERKYQERNNKIPTYNVNVRD